MRQALATLLCVLPCSAGAAVVQVRVTDNLQTVLNGLQPGDEAIFSAGTYALTPARLGVTLVGTASRPILLHTDGGKVVIQRADTGQNLIDFADAQYLEIRDLEFVGGSRGLRFQQGSFVTVRNCVIHGTQSSALTTNDVGQTYSNFSILHNEIYDTAGTGEGMYLGCNNDGCRLQNSLIQGNHVHHTNGPGVTAGFGTAIQLKTGGSGNVLSDNVVHDTGAPCILVDSAAGHGGPNVVERNLLFNCGDHGIQASQDAVIRNNVILKVSSDGIAAMPHQAGTPQNLTIVHNTIVNPGGNSISVRMPVGSVVVANNALYPMGGTAFFANGTTSNIQFSGNVGLGAVSGLTGTLGAGTLAADFVAASWAGAPPMDLFPKAGGALLDAGVRASVPPDDFNGTLRQGVPDVGAYAFSVGGNPGWTLDAGFKPPPAPLADSGIAPDSGTAPDAGRDAGGLGGDAGAALDAGAGMDAGADGGGPGASAKGCGCDSTAAGGAGLLIAVALIRRKRTS